MRLADQIELLRETLEEHGYDIGEDSVGERAAQVIRALEENAEHLLREIKTYGPANGELKDALDAAEKALEQAAPSTAGLCDSCKYLKDGNLPRLCQNREAWRQEFSHRGYSVKAGYGCSEWDG